MLSDEILVDIIKRNDEKTAKETESEKEARIEKELVFHRNEITPRIKKFIKQDEKFGDNYIEAVEYGHTVFVFRELGVLNNIQMRKVLDKHFEKYVI